MKALDLFCGLGGWSDGLAAEGFEILGVEIVPEIAELYKHPVIVSDVCELNPEDFKGYDLIVGSPPCRNFSKMALGAGKRWKNPPDPKGEGLRLVNAFLDFVKIAAPKYWLMENVPGLVNYLEIKPQAFVNLSVQKYRCFWGHYPRFLIIKDYRIGFTKTHLKKNRIRENKGPLASWENARIPLPVARALGRAVRDAVLEKSQELELEVLNETPDNS